MIKFRNGSIAETSIKTAKTNQFMRKIGNLFVIATLSICMFSSCGISYRVSTNFYLLQRGMTKQQFIEWQGLNNGKDYVGKKPVSSKSFRYGDNIWEVWVYKVYDCRYDCYFDHYEHVAFVNGKIEEWGTGELPLTIRQNPNQFQYDININR
jgi:hypothetical protein